MSFKTISKKIVTFFFAIVFIVAPLYSIQTPNANAQLDGVAGSLASCGLSTVTQTIKNSLSGIAGDAIDDVLGGASGSASTSEVPTTDATTQGLINTTNSLTDTGNNLIDQGNSLFAYKEYILDCLVREAAQILLENVVDSLMGWTNTGFGGSSFYVQNPASFYAGIETSIAENFLSGTLPSALQGSPYSSQVTSLVREGQSRPTLKEKLACPDKNIDQVFQGGESDSWLAFMNAVNTPGCTPEGAYLTANKDLAGKQAGALSLAKEELDRNEGMLSKRDEYGNIVTPGNIITTVVKKNVEIGVEQSTQNDELAELFDTLLDKTYTSITSGLLESVGTGPSQSSGQTIEGLPWQNQSGSAWQDSQITQTSIQKTE